MLFFDIPACPGKALRRIFRLFFDGFSIVNILKIPAPLPMIHNIETAPARSQGITRA
jgi:hypothetical protein